MKKEDLVAIFLRRFLSEKRKTKWCLDDFKSQYVKDGVNERPHVSNVCNLHHQQKAKPSLLTFNEVTTLFHEFGHLHGMLANTTHPSLSGTSVYWDFVEVKSSHGKLVLRAQALALFATLSNWRSNLMEYVNKIKESASFQEGLQPCVS
jgi:peptidyl-dipeptidase Dcp